MANIHDITWGSRGSDGYSKQESKRDKKQRQDYENFRSNWLIVWIISNFAIGWFFVYHDREGKGDYLFYIIALFGSINLIKFVLAMLYSLRFCCKNLRMKAFKQKQMKSHGMTKSIESSSEWDEEAHPDFISLVQSSHNSKKSNFSSEEDSEVDEENLELSGSELEESVNQSHDKTLLLQLKIEENSQIDSNDPAEGEQSSNMEKEESDRSSKLEVEQSLNSSSI